MKLMIPAAVERKLNAYVQSVDGEIAGFGKLATRDDGNLWVEDVAIFTQEVTGGTADLAPQAIAAFQTEIIKRGESPKQWYLWWHSHNTFSAFFSGIDTGTIQTSTEFDHLVSLVVNKKRERKCRLDTHRPFRLMLDNVTVEVVPEMNARILALENQISALMDEITTIQSEVPGGLDSIEKEVKAKVTVKTYTKPAGYGNHGQARRVDIRSEDYNESWSKSAKKDGGVITPEEIVTEKFDRDEIEVLIEVNQKTVKAHEANGNADSAECETLRGRVSDLQSLLIELDDGAYDNEYVYWNGHRWSPYAEYSADDMEQDELGLIPLNPPYKYGFTRDEERG